jgi:hypothetical protein
VAKEERSCAAVARSILFLLSVPCFAFGFCP